MKSILFDLDGTLIVSHTGIIASLKYTIETLGIDCLKGVDLLCFVGPPLKQSFMEFAKMSDAEADQAVRVFRRHYANKGIFDSVLYDGIYSMLENLSRKSNIYICTSKPRTFTDRLTEHFKIAQFFTDIVGSSLDNSLSKKDDIIEYTIQKNNIDKRQAIMVGDKYQDVHAAELCGIKSIGILYGYGTVDELRQGNATEIVGSVNALKNLLEDYVCRE